MSDFITNAELRIEAERLCDENAELRELVNDMYLEAGAPIGYDHPLLRKYVDDVEVDG